MRYSTLLMVSGLFLGLLLLAEHYHFWSPKMAVEPLTVHFGHVSFADEVRREITVKNVSRGALILEKVLPSCSSCIAVHSFPKEPIPPGKQGKIDFSLDVLERQGNVESAFIIISNAKPQKTCIVNVTAHVLTEKR